ncbi:hypothetical protein LguiB_010783 [Lonicera macranthoides]
MPLFPLASFFFLCSSQEYTESKTLAEKEILSQENDESSGIEVFLEDLLGKVPIVHIEDVCEKPISSVWRHLFQSMGEILVYLDGTKREIEWASSKLNEMDFVCKYETKNILDDCVSCAKKKGDLRFMKS